MCNFFSAAKTSKSRQTSDIIRFVQLHIISTKISHFIFTSLALHSLLVNIYGSREMFVNEYRNLLADRLLQNTGYNTSREVSGKCCMDP